jgi:hypothetical protein
MEYEQALDYLILQTPTLLSEYLLSEVIDAKCIDVESNKFIKDKLRSLTSHFLIRMIDEFKTIEKVNFYNLPQTERIKLLLK